MTIDPTFPGPEYVEYAVTAPPIRARTETAQYGSPRMPFSAPPVPYPDYREHGDRPREYLLDVAAAAAVDCWLLTGDRPLVQDLCADYGALADQLDAERLEHAATAGRLRSAEEQLADMRRLAVQQANLHLAELKHSTELQGQLARLSGEAAQGLQIWSALDRVMLARTGQTCAQAMAAVDLEERERRAIELHAEMQFIGDGDVIGESVSMVKLISEVTP